jgi:pimeloyl-ACP methyl ester carboxylesterase
MNYLYLHGFASGPASTKAQFLRSRFAEQGITVCVPDLNLDNFSTVTLSKQRQYLRDRFAGEPLVVIGSSLGGLLASLIAQDLAEVERLVLLAPAFEFSQRLALNIGAEAIADWQTHGSLDFYHYGFKQVVQLQYEFFADAQTHTEKSLQRQVPILILHGLNDEVVPASVSQSFAASRPHVTLELLDSDHGLADVLEPIWQKIRQFLNII